MQRLAISFNDFAIDEGSLRDVAKAWKGDKLVDVDLFVREGFLTIT